MTRAQLGTLTSVALNMHLARLSINDISEIDFSNVDVVYAESHWRSSAASE